MSRTSFADDIGAEPLGRESSYLALESTSLM